MVRWIKLFSDAIPSKAMGDSETSFRRRVSNGLLVQRPFDVEKRNSEQFGQKSLKSEYRMYYNSSKRRSIRVFAVSRVILF